MERHDSLKDILLNAYDRMYQHFGSRHWWPANSTLEIIVGAILTQNTAWANVEKAIENIKAAGGLSIKRLSDIPGEILAEWIRPSGYFNIKTRRLKAIIHFIGERYEGNLEKMASVPLDTLRKELLNIYGIGEETADSILLYAFEKPIFVIDAYTRRIFARHRLVGEKSPYNEIQRFFMSNLPKNVPFFNEYHALIVETGKTFCRRKPLCSPCPLLGFNSIFTEKSTHAA